MLPCRIDNKKHEFWQRNPLAVYLYSRKVAFQKLDYMHRNPLAEQKTRVKINIHQPGIMK